MVRTSRSPARLDPGCTSQSIAKYCRAHATARTSHSSTISAFTCRPGKSSSIGHSPAKASTTAIIRAGTDTTTPATIATDTPRPPAGPPPPRPFASPTPPEPPPPPATPKLPDNSWKDRIDPNDRSGIPGLPETYDSYYGIPGRPETYRGASQGLPLPFAPDDPPYRVTTDGVDLQFDPKRLAFGIQAAHAHGLIDHATYHQMLPKAIAAQVAMQEEAALVAHNELAAKIKALGYGAVKGAVFLGGAKVGARTGAWLGGFGGPFAEITEPAGAIGGGLLGGYVAQHGAEQLAEQLGKYSDTVKSFTDASAAHPSYDKAGGMVAIAFNIPRSIANLGKEASMRLGRGATRKGVALALGTRILTAGALSAAIDTAIKEGARLSGHSFEGQTLSGATEAFLIGAFLSGQSISFKSHAPSEVGAILIKARDATARGINPATVLTRSEVEIAQAAVAEINRVRNSGAVLPANPRVRVAPAFTVSESHGLNAGTVEHGSAGALEGVPYGPQIQPSTARPIVDAPFKRPALLAPKERQQGNAILSGPIPLSQSRPTGEPFHISATRSPQGNLPNARKWIRNGGRIVYSSDKTTYILKDGTSVTYDASGFPDFTPYLYRGLPGQNQVSIALTGSRYLDEIAANLAAGFDQTPLGYTWHHNEDPGRMELVEREIHEAFYHTGGYSRQRK